MQKPHSRLTEITPEELAQLQAEAEELADLQTALNKLPLGLQVEDLSQVEQERLRQIAKSPEVMLCGDGLLIWNNQCRERISLIPRI